jgi:hypothetical protein
LSSAITPRFFPRGVSRPRRRIGPQLASDPVHQRYRHRGIGEQPLPGVYRALVFLISDLLAQIEPRSKGYVFRGQGQSDRGRYFSVIVDGISD